MAGNRGVIIEHRGVAAALSATAASLHVGVYPVKNMFTLECIRCCAVISAEAAPYATRRSTLGDGYSRGEVDHVKSVHVAGGICDRRRKMACSNLRQKFRLDLRIIDGAAGHRRNNSKLSVEGAMPNGLIGATGNGGVVLAQHVHVSAVRDVSKEAGYAGRRGPGNLRGKRAVSPQYLNYMNIRNYRSPKVTEVCTGGCRESYRARVGISP